MDEFMTNDLTMSDDPWAVTPPGKVIERKPPDVSEPRSALVKHWLKRIERAEGHWDDAFKEMRRDALFVAGNQWNDKQNPDFYTANITIRHINQRVSSIYAKNPRVRADRKEKIWPTKWDGSPEGLEQAQAVIAEALMHAQAGLPYPRAGELPGAQEIVAEAAEIANQKALAARMAKTLELVAQYSLDEPIPRFKIQAKQLVRRVLTCKVGYIKLGYQRLMGQTPDVLAKIKDISDRVSYLETLAADLADEMITVDSKEAEELKLNLEALQRQKDVVDREGLMFAFPKSWNIIVDPNCSQLKGFVGADWIAEKYLFTPRQVQTIYGIDVSKQFSAYTINGTRSDASRESHTRMDNDTSYCAVYEVYDLVGQVCFTVIAGYPDFARPPSEPDITLEQFHPYFALSFNDVENPDTIFPPSDVELIKPMAMEYNRMRQALRNHRIANTPATITTAGVFDAETKGKLATHEPHEVIETQLGKNDDINKLLVPKPTVPIQPGLYDTEEIFLDTQRVVGAQSADFGGTAGASATEVSVADASRISTLQSNVDDLDEFLTDVMRAAGQVLFLEMSPETAKAIAGPGAAWPVVSPEEAAKELVLSVKAGSSGRPNKAARMAAIEKMGPLLMQIQGIKPRKLGEFMIQELDENIDIDDFFDEKLPSMVAMNAQAAPNQSGTAPGPATAAAGAMNAPAPAESGAKTQNMNPTTADAPPTLQ